jgi:YD repeat-containing protein
MIVTFAGSRTALDWDDAGSGVSQFLPGGLAQLGA